MLRKLTFLIIAVMLSVVPVLSQDGSSIVIAQGTDAASLDPQLQNDAFTTSILNNVFDTLIYRSQELALEPGLATAWENVEDTVWELTLREGVTFHDGDAFNAEDVKFSLERPLDPDLGSPLTGRFSVIDSVDVVDEFTVRVNTVDPYPLLPARLSEWFMISKEYVESTDPDVVAENPVGTGAYQLVEWTRDEALVLTAYADHWRGAPEIENVTFRPIPETSTRVAALQAGDVNLITNVPAFRQADVNGTDGLEIRSTPSTFIQYVALDGTKNEALADIRVRQALQYGTNVEEIVEFLFEGSAAQIAVPLAFGTFGLDESFDPYPYDPDLARELLAEAGYADGFTLEIDAPTGRYAQDQEVAEALAGQWEQIGVEVVLNINAWPDQLSKYRDGDALAEAHFMGWGTSTFDADDIMFAAFARQPTKNNYTNDELTEIVLNARTSLDPAEREQLYSEALQIVYDELPWLILFQQFDIYGVDSNLEWAPRQDQKIEVRTISLGS
ncbi:MAG: ABC transporter substrate-binding protein [Chloroflexota bacterium]